ncbi:AraC-type DNA-binding protein [Micromonospora phaseoli]|uniref:AraC-type DNA-binding protein n=1 Tax=Micromonospora phaseoli TaxID=1144548 RepID=A0A1H7E0R4_9ACTN|nr:AraC family transcriptional regulator [Micromonospora phaseoli]PZW00515.1 AraC family transcriptional regulator [Micromonospora phaseoli]GIJ81439.1 cupin [Micromonospora phaseoli]SEK07284.1 AraC-type DNA-binding protein [Micromonospora phaseoli]
MDPIDLALRDLRVTGSMVGRTLVDPPWGLSVQTDDPCVLAAVIAGEMWVTRGNGAPVHLGRGDVAVAEGGVPLRLGDTPASKIDVVVTDRDACYDPATGADLSESCLIGGRTFGNPGASVSVLVASFHTSGEGFRFLAEHLPPLVVLSANPHVTPILDVVAAETVLDRPGQQVTVDRLMEVLGLASLRSWLRAAPDDVPSWATALDDAVVGPALRAMHAEPGRPWTVSGLAEQSAVSRAAFARRFTERVGVAPLTHLARWRMAVATDLIRDQPRLGLSEVARRVGYGDAFSFSNAYRRIRGVPPSRARRRDPAPVGAAVD